MLEQLQPGRRTEVFHHPDPFDLIKISTGISDREITPPPRTYLPATNPEEKIRAVTTDLIEAFGNHLLFVGLTGSRVVSSNREGSDLDVIVIVDDDATAGEVSFEGDLEVVSYTGLRAYIECGFQFITNQFRKAQPLFEREGILDELRSFRLIPEKAIPFLVARSRFTEQTADILKLTSDKYRAIFLFQQEFQDEAFSQLKRAKHDDLFRRLQEDLNAVNSGVYAMLAKYYANIGLNRMFQSLSEMIQALHVKEMGSIADVEELVEWALKRTGEAGILLKHIYEKRIACYKRGELLLDTEYDMMRQGIREQNGVIESMILGK